jgi:hypothetical protein
MKTHTRVDADTGGSSHSSDGARKGRRTLPPACADEEYVTPFERGNGNQTTTYAECVAFYKRLAARFPHVLQFEQVGLSDAGWPLYLGVVMNNMIPAIDFFDCFDVLRTSGRPVLFNNNGHHPGEPEGIDVCMAIVRDCCLIPGFMESSLGEVIYFFNPVYNVDGCLNRNTTSRTNQNGPELLGYRCNSLNLDQNRDMIKCDSLTSQVMNRLITQIDPDVMIDTHCSNGADYQYTMTLIHTQPDKLGGQLGRYLKETMLPQIYMDMNNCGWPTCPFINHIGATPDEGIEDFPDSPRFLSGFCALKHIVGLVPETHMLKPYTDRVESMREFIEVITKYVKVQGRHIKILRSQERSRYKDKLGNCYRSTVSNLSSGSVALAWETDTLKSTVFNFCGFEATYIPSLLGDYHRLAYDRSKPYTRPIVYYNTCRPSISLDSVLIPIAYLVPRAYTHTIVERLRWNMVHMHQLRATDFAGNDGKLHFSHNKHHIQRVTYYRIDGVKTRTSYEGHPFHTDVHVSTHETHLSLGHNAHVGDYVVYLSEQEDPRYVVEVLEPEGQDSFFRWGFFNAVLEKKEDFSDYIFEDEAIHMLEDDVALRIKFDAWKMQNPELIRTQDQVLRFIFENGKRYCEPEHGRYPVLKLFC